MKKLLLGTGLTLLLAGCGGDPTPTASTVRNVSGTVVEALPSTNGMELKTTAWTGGAGKVIARSRQDGSELARGTLNADGSFSLLLPASVSNLNTMETGDLQDFQPSNYTGTLTCTGTPSVSNRDVRGVMAALSVDANKDGGIDPMTLSGTETATSRRMTSKFGGLIYVDRDVQFSGTQTCTGTRAGVTETATTRLAANLRTGWNFISGEYSLQLTRTDEQTSTITTHVTLTSGELPTNQWVFGNIVAYPASLNPDALSPR